MKFTRTFVCSVAATLCLGAGGHAQEDLRIDGSSDAAFMASLEQVKKSMDPRDRQTFEQTLRVMQAFAASKDLVRRRLNGAPPAKVLEFGRRMMSQLDTNNDGKIGAEEMATIRTQVAAARKKANESAAIATLRNVASAQAQIQAMGVVDTDENGRGEFCYFAEMTGAAKLRDVKGPSRITLRRPVLSQAFQVAKGRVERSGYLYQIWLPGPGGVAVPEAGRGGVDRESMPAAAGAEKRWICYAWPVKNGETGSRVFAIDQTGQLVVSDNLVQRYSGTLKAPSPYAAMAAGQKVMSTLKVPAARNDRGAWQRNPVSTGHARPPRRR